MKLFIYGLKTNFLCLKYVTLNPVAFMDNLFKPYYFNFKHYNMSYMPS